MMKKSALRPCENKDVSFERIIRLKANGQLVKRIAEPNSQRFQLPREDLKNE
jgi:hypothetical protein